MLFFVFWMLVTVVAIALLYKNREEEEEFLIIKLIGYLFLGSFRLNLSGLILPLGYVLSFLLRPAQNRGIKRGSALVGFIFMILSLFNQTVWAAPDPSEVEKIKSESALHVIGTVISDELIQDLTKEKERPYQLRKMKLQIEEVISAKSPDQKLDMIEVFYHYYPSWQTDLYVGDSRMDIAVGDKIEIWLEKREQGWESALGGNTVKHLKYAEDRKEPIPEPSSSKTKKEMKKEILMIWDRYQPIFVFVGVFSLAMLLFGITRRKQINKGSF